MKIDHHIFCDVCNKYFGTDDSNTKKRLKKEHWYKKGERHFCGTCKHVLPEFESY
jgi:hypothetical protein